MEQMVSILTGIGFLIILSVIDFLTYNKKKGYIPSVLTTSFLIVMFILGGTSALYFGVLAGLLALLFVDLEMFSGIADLKVFVAGAMAFSTLTTFLVYSVFVVVLSFIVKYIFNSFVAKKKLKNFQFPFIPIILLSYCLTLLMMVLVKMI